MIVGAMILDRFAHKCCRDHYVRTVSRDCGMSGNSPQPMIETEARQGNIVVSGRDSRARRFAVRSKCNKMASATKPIGAEIKEKGTVVPDAGIANVSNLLVGLAFTREDRGPCLSQCIEHNWLCQVE